MSKKSTKSPDDLYQSFIDMFFNLSNQHIITSTSDNKTQSEAESESDIEKRIYKKVTSHKISINHSNKVNNLKRNKVKKNKKIVKWIIILINIIMRSINPKCSNVDSFKYSILISIHYYDLKIHKEWTKQLNKYLNEYNFNSNNFQTFENDNPYLSLIVYDENKELIHKSINKSLNIACIVKINNHRYHALTPHKDKYIQLRKILNQLSQKELFDSLI